MQVSHSLRNQDTLYTICESCSWAYNTDDDPELEPCEICGKMICYNCSGLSHIAAILAFEDPSAWQYVRGGWFCAQHIQYREVINEIGQE